MKIYYLTIVVFALALFTSCEKDDESSNSFTDSRDGNTYKLVTIGEQTWMAENLAFQPTGGDYWSPGGDAGNVGTYGYLYTWQAAQSAAPAGWHIPTKAEWDELSNYLGTNADGGGKMKEEGTTHWQSPNTGATNASGFSALPAGGRFFDNKYFGEYAYFWTATESTANFATYYYLYSGDKYLHTSSNAMQFGFSVRCIKD